MQSQGCNHAILSLCVTVRQQMTNFPTYRSIFVDMYTSNTPGTAHHHTTTIIMFAVRSAACVSSRVAWRRSCQSPALWRLMEITSGAPSVSQAHAQRVVAMPTLGAVGWLGDGQQACQFWSSPVALGDGEQEEKEAAVVADAGADAGAAAPEVAEEVAGEAAEGEQEGEEDEWTPRSTIAEQTLSEDELAGNQAYVPSHTHAQRHVHLCFIAMTAF